jgi:DNA-binding MarR family transcriptional regulator
MPASPRDESIPTLTASLVALMGLLHSRFAGESLQLMVEANLTLPQMVTLHMLRLRGQQTVGAIGQALSLSPSATSHLVDRLHERGFLTREEDPADRRQKLIAATPAGVELLNRLDQARFAQISRTAAEIEPDLRDRLVAVIEQVTQQLRNGEPGPCPES